jgi:DNA-binding response OmpR family regulator
MDMLRYLVEHRGQVVSRETLLAEVWGHQSEIETRSVDNYIVRLRKKLEAEPAEPRYLITVYGSGYKLVDQ